MWREPPAGDRGRSRQRSTAASRSGTRSPSAGNVGRRSRSASNPPAPRPPVSRGRTPTNRQPQARNRSSSAGSRGSWGAPAPLERGRTRPGQPPTGRTRSRSDSARGRAQSSSQQCDSSASPGGIDVFARLRPAFSHEDTAGDSMRALALLEDERSVYVRDRFVEERTMDFTRTFDQDSTQGEVYAHLGKPVVDAALQGKNGTFLAYGQTGTGKTYTAFNYAKPEDGGDPSTNGLMFRCVQDLFRRIHEERAQYTCDVTMQFMQLYNDQIQDLLKGMHDDADATATDLSTTVGSLNANASGVTVYNNSVVTGLTSLSVATAEEVMALYDRGMQHRTVRLTTMNAQSSRSHAVFILRVDRTERLGGGSLSATTLQGRLTIVDLAGSERIKRTKADGLQRAEAQAINRSLACLGNVIHALAESSASDDPNRRHHIPYRDSKLTRLLQDSLGEHGHACILVTFSPAVVDITETVSSLAFGQRARMIMHKSKQPRCAVDPKRLASQQQVELHTLRAENTSLRTEVSNLKAQLLRQQEAKAAPPAADKATEEALRAEVSDLKKVISEDEALICEMETYIQKMRDVRDTIKAELDRVTAKLHVMEQNEDHVSAERMQLTSELITSRSDAEIQGQELNNLRREIDSLRSQSRRDPSLSAASPHALPTHSPLDDTESPGRSNSATSPAPTSPPEWAQQDRTRDAEQSQSQSLCSLGMGVAPFRKPLQPIRNQNYQTAGT